MDCFARRRRLQRRERIILCMNVGVTTASGSASSMRRGSWSRDDDGSDVHNAAGWIESWRRVSGLRPSPRRGQVLARAFNPGICLVQQGACDWRIGIVGGKGGRCFRPAAGGRCHC